MPVPPARQNGSERAHGRETLSARPPTLPEVYETYHRRVLAYAAKLLGSYEAEDIAQEVFVKVGRAL